MDLIKIMSSFRVLSPGDAVSKTGMPRYLVLAAFKALEELGFIEPIYAKGTHRVYKLTPLAERFLELGIEDLALVVGAGIEHLEEEFSGDTPSGEAAELATEGT